MLQCLATPLYISISTLPSRDTSTDPFYLIHQDSCLNDWSITATDNTLHLVTSIPSPLPTTKTTSYHLPIASIFKGDFALRIILEDGSYRFLNKPDALYSPSEGGTSTYRPYFSYLLVQEADHAKSELIKKGEPWLSCSKIDEMIDLIGESFDLDVREYRPPPITAEALELIEALGFN